MPRLMPMKGGSGERHGEGLCFQTKALPQRRMPSVPVADTSSLGGGPLGAEEPRSPYALQSPPLTRPRGQLCFPPRRGWEKMAQT